MGAASTRLSQLVIAHTASTSTVRYEEEGFRRIREAKPCSAAHNAVGLAGESLVVGIDCLPTELYSTLARGDPASASSNVNVLVMEG